MDDRFRQQGHHTPSGNQIQPLAPHQYNGPQSHLHTLPPLTGSGSSFPSLYGHANNLNSHAPSSSGPNTSNAGIPSFATHPTLRPIQPSPAYGLSNPSFASSQAPFHPSSTAHTNTHSLAHGLAGGLQDMRTGGMGLSSHSQLYPPPILPNQEPEPVHVVGQQGRRGVLPTHPGRPAPATGKAPANPTKNADNKYECPHCIKTYLHLKHLKRHLLRHTGERPYQCHLCKDTFSRSDILKRHFQKCSIRRGNPTGANHLTHAQNHLQKNRLSTGAPEANSYLGHINTSMAFTDAAHANALAGMPPFPSDPSAYAGPLSSMSARTSRSNSLIRPSVSQMDNMNRRSMSALEFANASANLDGNNYRSSAFQTNLPHGLNTYTSQQGQSSAQVSTSANPYSYEHAIGNHGLSQSGPVKAENNTPTTYGRPTQNGDGMNGAQENDLKWNGSFTPGSHDNYLIQSSMTSNDHPHDGMFNGLYTGGSGFGDGSHMLSWPIDNLDPLQSKADALISFCYPEPSMLMQGSNDAQGLQTLKSLLTAENLKHFLEGYKNFHIHWPMIHMPTFDPMSANNGLVLAMVCIGAVYSEKLGLPQVRWLMELAKTSVHRSSHVYKTVTQSPSYPANSDRNMTSDIEEITALCLLHALFIWHGSHNQREGGRGDYWILVEVARRYNLFSPVQKGQQGFSVLHQPGEFNSDDVEAWTWDAWVEQEKRIRVFYLIFLLDTALGIFFNCAPQFDVNKISLPLPADDAAWEASTQEECAAALGLHGENAQDKNSTGSKRAKQMGMLEAVRIFHKVSEYKPRATNAYGKFIIIHALHNQIFRVQRQYQFSTSGGSRSSGHSPSSENTPRSQNDHSSPEGANNGSHTPTNGTDSQQLHYQQQLRAASVALDHWKKAWELDQQLQYPRSQRRAGYCRDAIHYYFLAKMFIRSQRREEWQAPPDTRCQQVFGFLKQIRIYVATEQEKKGLDIGSVTHVDDSYGVEDLTLDMKLLFTPIDESAD
ncbi:hypothetical protein GQ43DRAFT_254403 [Delitschia confertaspora ATCC 74209]|uniref:C2H2-type domain-containing protein n=1 Tax=Delitschia confertaspora ATCC 74209 TaxID=1513339 RepID=A0A9P4JBY7_9PLEO|nr:hypothetical protein GQ43DRAFT_254403 [Delitschia confertaspora ATCC 74209]